MTNMINLTVGTSAINFQTLINNTDANLLSDISKKGQYDDFGLKVTFGIKNATEGSTIRVGSVGRLPTATAGFTLAYGDTIFIDENQFKDIWLISDTVDTKLERIFA